jgi:transposase
MKQYLESQRKWMQVETLPSYSPDLNPDDALWSNIKVQKFPTVVLPDMASVLSLK